MDETGIKKLEEISYMKGNILQFVKYVKIVEPGGEVQYELWPHLVRFFQELKKGKLIIVLKSKQIGISWALAVYVVHHIIYTPNANVLMISKGEDEAKELLSKCKVVYFSLPLWMKGFTCEPNSIESFGLKERGSKIRALPSTTVASIGETASLVIGDEADFHPFAQENYAHTKPTIDAGGQMVLVSTADKSEPDSWFKRLYKDARSNKNDFFPLFFGYNSNPRRTEEWLKRERQVAKDGGYLWMVEQNYPTSEEEALSPLSAQSVFDKEALDNLWYNACQPVETRKGITHIFEKPQVGWKYAAGADVGEGVGLDYSVLTIIGKYGGQFSVSAIIYSNTIKTDMFAYEIDQLCGEYFYPELAVENNSLGVATINKLLELNYKNLFSSDAGKKKAGWTTGETNKEIAMMQLVQNINNGSLITRFKPQIQEMMEYQYIQGRTRKIKPSPTGKTHGDTVISLAIALQMAKNIKNIAKTTIYCGGRKLYG